MNLLPVFIGGKVCMEFYQVLSELPVIFIDFNGFGFSFHIKKQLKSVWRCPENHSEQVIEKLLDVFLTAVNPRQCFTADHQFSRCKAFLCLQQTIVEYLLQ